MHADSKKCNYNLSAKQRHRRPRMELTTSIILTSIIAQPIVLVHPMWFEVDHHAVSFDVTEYAICVAYNIMTLWNLTILQGFVHTHI
jgi:hypothetical protein